jgi:O-antigen ligase
LKSLMNRKATVDWYYLIPVIMFLAVVPLIVYMKQVPVTGVAYQLWKGGHEHSDFFSYYKSLWIIISAGLAVGTFALYTYIKKSGWKKNWLFIPILVYALFIILSTILAQYKEIALFGFPDRHEGMLVLLGYLIMCMLAFQLVNKTRDIKVTLATLFASATLIGTIGIFQYFGHDIFRSLSGRLLILPSAYHYMAEGLNFNFGAGTIYSTLYNTNNVGSYMAMLFPLTLVLFIMVRGKVSKAVIGVISSLMFANLIGCGSRAGYVGSLIAIIFIAVFLWNRLRQEWKSVGVILLCLILIFVGMDYWGQGRVSGQVKRMVADVHSPNKVVTDIEQPSAVDLQGEDTKSQARMERLVVKDIPIEMGGNQLNLYSKSGIIKISLGDGQITFKDQENKELGLNVVLDGEKYTIADPRFSDYAFYPGSNTLKVEQGNKNIYFRTADGQFRLCDSQGQELALKSIPTQTGIVAGIQVNITGNRMYLEQNELRLNIEKQNGKIIFSDTQNKKLKLDMTTGAKEFGLKDLRYAGYQFIMHEPFMDVHYGDKVLYFALGDSGFHYVNKEGEELVLPSTEQSQPPALAETTPAVVDIKVEANKIVVYTDKTQLHINWDGNKLVVTDEKGAIVNCTHQAWGGVQLTDVQFNDYLIGTAEDRLRLQKGNRVINFALTDKGIRFVDIRGKVYEAQNIPSWGFENREQIGSGRGYIWSRTIPMLKDTVIVGHGPDTYTIYFPQHDFVGKFKYLLSGDIIVDKPHNMYLQTAVNTGILSLIALFVLFIGYIISSISLYRKSEYDNFYAVAGFAIFVALLGYMGTGFFNDSIVSVAPVFWGLLGMGIACNSLQRGEDSNQH